MVDVGEKPNYRELQEAVARYREMVRQNPGDVRLLTNLAWAYERAKDFSQAIDLFGQAIQVDSDNTDAHFGLGLALLGNQQIRDALQSFQRARELASRSEDRGYTAIVQHHVDVFFRRYG